MTTMSKSQMSVLKMLKQVEAGLVRDAERIARKRSWSDRERARAVRQKLREADAVSYAADAFPFGAAEADRLYYENDLFGVGRIPRRFTVVKGGRK